MNRLLIVGLLLLIAFSSRQSFAAPSTDFPACINPQGTLIADHPQGTHGIINNTGLYIGSDKVYLLANGNVMQCYCGANNEGIQTNWVKNTGFTDAESSILKKQGWTLIPDGSVWGLDPVQYFAMNSSYACSGGNPTLEEKHDNPSPASSVLGASTTVVTTLAHTGNTFLFLASLVTGMALIVAGIFLPGNNKSSR